MDNLTHYLATTLRMLRHQRGWSLSRLAEISGVSKAMLGQIERNESSPTVATLWKIATGLNVPFSMFISPPQAEFPPTFDPQQQAMVITPLFPWDPELCFDYFLYDNFKLDDYQNGVNLYRKLLNALVTGDKEASRHCLQNVLQQNVATIKNQYFM